MVVINRTRKDSCENGRVLLLLTSYNHGVRPSVQSGASNARSKLGWSRATPQCTPTLLSKQQVELFHTDRWQEFNVNSYSGSFKVMHLGTTEKPSKGCISRIYILHILTKISEHIASNKRRKLRSSTTPLLFDATSPMNPGEYPNIPYIYRNQNHCPTFCR